MQAIFNRMAFFILAKTGSEMVIYFTDKFLGRGEVHNNLSICGDLLQCFFVDHFDTTVVFVN